MQLKWWWQLESGLDHSLCSGLSFQLLLCQLSGGECFEKESKGTARVVVGEMSTGLGEPSPDSWSLFFLTFFKFK